MNILTHGLLSWSLATRCVPDRKARIVLTVAGILPDADGFGYLPELLSKGRLEWFSAYHHILAHNLTAALAGALVVALAFRNRWLLPVYFFLFYHMHLLCDLAGGRGPDGYEWPIPYLWPFKPSLELSWQGQWALNAWPNFAITFLCLGYVFYFAWKKGFSPLEMISRGADEKFVETLRRRFGGPKGEPC